MFMQQLPKPGAGVCVAVEECERTITSAPLKTPAVYMTVFAAGEASSSAGVPYTVTVPGVLDRVRKDRKSTRLNSSHQIISYAVFCLKKKNNHNQIATGPRIHLV